MLKIFSNNSPIYKEYKNSLLYNEFKISYLQYLVINYYKIDNVIDLIKEDIKNNNINYINYHDKIGDTVLISAYSLLSTDKLNEIIILLIENGADINLKNNKNNNISPLLLCSNEYISYSTFKILVDNGADLNIKNNWNKNLLMKFCYSLNNTSLDKIK
tara:strand:+ start:348 stop:824 length:477 start_codon:yes stop_codon:yes gene_type:complete